MLIAVLTKVITLEQLSWSQRVVVASVIGVVPGLKSSALVSVKKSHLNQASTRHFMEAICLHYSGEKVLYRFKGTENQISSDQ